jgi:hypothetical protein
VAGSNRAQRSDRLQSSHRPQPGFEPAVVGFDSVVGVLLEHVTRTWGQLVDHARIDRRPVGGHLDRRRTCL